MKIRNILSTAALATALAFAGPAMAQEKSPPTPVADEQVASATVEMASDAMARPALWKVADEDTTIYLFGTVHFLPEDLEWYGPVISSALESSDVLVTELGDLTEDPAQVQASAMKYGLLPQGQTLRGMLNDNQRTQYEAALAEMGVPAASLDPLKPWLAAIQLTVMQLAQLGYNAESGVESVLDQKAKDKPKVGLETIDYQFGLFDSMPQDDQIAFLMEAIGELDEARSMMDGMVLEWAAGDAVDLAQLMNESMTTAKMAETILYQRNRDWVEWIDTRLDTPGTVFVAVGAGHLAGEKSVQDYLDDRDIQSSRVQ